MRAYEFLKEYAGDRPTSQSMQPIYQGMTPTENSFVTMTIEKGRPGTAHFYTPEQDEDREYSSFAEFAKDAIESELPQVDGQKIAQNEGYAYSPDGDIVLVINGTQDFDRRQQQLLQYAQQDLASTSHQADAEAHEAEAERRDPYKARGFSRSDFM